MTPSPAVSIKDLTIALPAGGDRPMPSRTSRSISTPGEIVCVVGESGSGKSMCAHALMGLLPDSVKTEAGPILFEGGTFCSSTKAACATARPPHRHDFPGADDSAQSVDADRRPDRRDVRGARLLEPRQRKRSARPRARVGLPDPERIVRAYPHQLSGGQRQRAMIAMALALEPAVLIADEPTTALDVTTQAQILELIRELQRADNMAVLFITHDFGVVAEIADRIVVHAGTARWSNKELQQTCWRHPQHAYTRALLAAVPSLRSAAATSRSASATSRRGRSASRRTIVTPGGWFRPDARCRRRRRSASRSAEARRWGSSANPARANRRWRAV